jgi:hypothetical protein
MPLLLALEAESQVRTGKGMADEWTTTKHQRTKVTKADIAAIAFQICLVGLVSVTGFFQYFAIAFAAYVGMAASIAWRSRKNGPTNSDRKALLFSFVPIFVLATILTLLIWLWKYS